MGQIKDLQLVKILQSLNFLNVVIVKIQIIQFSEHMKTFNLCYTIVVQMKSFEVYILGYCLRNDSLKSFVLEIQNVI